MHLTFLNLFDVRYQNNLIGVEWSVPIELFYYLFIPSVFLYVRKDLSRLIYLLSISGVLYIMLPRLIHEFYFPIDTGLSYLWSIEKLIFTFVCGIFA